MSYKIIRGNCLLLLYVRSPSNTPTEDRTLVGVIVLYYHTVKKINDTIKVRLISVQADKIRGELLISAECVLIVLLQ